MYAARLLPRTCGGAGQFRFRALSSEKPHLSCVQAVFFNLSFKESRKRRPRFPPQDNRLPHAFSSSLAPAKHLSFRALKKISFPQPATHIFSNFFLSAVTKRKRGSLFCFLAFLPNIRQPAPPGATGQGAIMAASCACLSCACLSRLAEVAVRNCPRQVSFSE